MPIIRIMNKRSICGTGHHCGNDSVVGRRCSYTLDARVDKLIITGRSEGCITWTFT